MATFKGDNSTTSLVEENNGWGKAPSSYAGGKLLQSNDGSFTASRNSLESEARTPNAELAGVRLGNSNVAGTFNVEIDPENYNSLFESLFYAAMDKSGAAVSATAKALEGKKIFELEVALTSAEQVTLGANIGDPVRLSGIASAAAKHLEGMAVLIAKTATKVTLYHPSQDKATFTSVSTNFTINPVDTLRPAKTRKSFNVEETLTAEDGSTKARFMTVGAVASGVAFDMPQEGNIKGAFSMIGSGKRASQEYKEFDTNLTNSAAAHTGLVAHEKYTPMVLQDGAILSGAEDTRCIWLSGSVTLENGTEPYFVGCSYDAAGATSGKFRVSVSYEALFRSEDDFVNFNKENSSRMLLRLKDRTTDRGILIYLPAFKATAYDMKNATGLVTATVGGVAEIDTASVNSIVMGFYHG